MSPDDTDEALSRRKWLQITGGIGAAGLLAGCSGDGGGGDGGSDGGDGSDGDGGGDGGDGGDGGGDEPLYFHFPATGSALSEIQFNLWNPKNQPGYSTRLLWDQLTQYLTATTSHEPWLATDWNREGESFTIDIREGITWHSGQNVTAQDVVNHFRLGKLFDFSVWDFAESVEAPEDQRVEFTLKGANPSIAETKILRETLIYTHPELHKDFIERERDASSEDERNSVREDLLNHTISPDEAKGTLGHGPVVLEEATSQSMTFAPYEDYPIGWDGGNEMNWAGVKVTDYGQEESSMHEAAIADEIDALTGSTSEKVRKKFPDHWEIVPTPRFWGHGLFFSPKSKWGEDTEKSRKLRQAIAYLYNPKEWHTIYGEEVTNLPEVNNVTGMTSPTMDENWLDGVLDGFTNYGDAESGWVQEEKAAQKLRSAGYERNSDDMWVSTDSGEALTAPVKFPAGWSALLATFRNISDQFQRFGIKSEPLGQENTSFFGNQVPNHEFQITTVVAGGGPHPYSAYREGAGLGSLGTPKWVYNNMMSEVTVPWPVGNPDGDLKTINYDEKVVELSQTTDSEKEKQLVQELAWITNQWVGVVECEARTRMHYVATDDWDYGVSTDDPKYRSEQFWSYLTRTGSLTAKK